MIQCPGFLKQCPGIYTHRQEKSLPRLLSPRLVMCAPLTRIDSSVWRNSSQEICPPVPSNNMTDSATATAPPPPKRKRNRVQRRERRAREREERARIDEAFNHDARVDCSELRSSFQHHCSRPTDHDRPTAQRAYISHAARGVPACHTER